ncbi:MAG: RNA-binding domain-containing protein, partial [archaeon]
MNKKELDFILQEGEGLKIEFKEGKSGFDKEIVAFANAEGGRVFFGVNDKSEILGVNINNKLRSEIQTIARNCDPSIEIKLEQFENILIIEVEEGKDKPYKCKEGFYMRIGANSQKMTRDEIMDFSMSEGKIKFDSQINTKFDFNKDFDKDKLNDYLKKANLSKSLPKEKILKELEVLNKSFNNAGVLFFSKEPQKFFHQSVYTAALFRDIEGADIIERK